jgi:hypothetical protein
MKTGSIRSNADHEPRDRFVEYLLLRDAMERRQLRWLAVGFDKIDGDKAIARPEHPGLDLYDAGEQRGLANNADSFRIVSTEGTNMLAALKCIRERLPV